MLRPKHKNTHLSSKYFLATPTFTARIAYKLLISWSYEEGFGVKVTFMYTFYNFSRLSTILHHLYNRPHVLLLEYSVKSFYPFTVVSSIIK